MCVVVEGQLNMPVASLANQKATEDYRPNFKSQLADMRHKKGQMLKIEFSKQS